MFHKTTTMTQSDNQIGFFVLNYFGRRRHEMSVKHFSVIKIVAGLEFRGSIPSSPTNIGE